MGSGGTKPGRCWKIPKIGFLRTTGLCGALILLGVTAGIARDLSEAELRWIGSRIFANECGGRAEALVAWNRGEAFASLGIGHFIWYPQGQHGPYAESFVDLVSFLRRRKIPLPAMLGATGSPDCPWPNREAFEAAARSPEKAELRLFLQRTMDDQTRFMVRRLDAALPRMITAAPLNRRQHLRQQYERLARTPAGLYALVDYVNFKGEGVAPTERIAGQGWGLSQVLEEMDNLPSVVAPLAEFARAAETVLIRRAEADPRAMLRDRWLPGWLARVRGYADPSR
ncbi:MAG: hypothetical protein JEZ11_00360 [Desulfobacterales bacterium]|nr:hypothetical protein [Desulfobacterales bacterium]